MTALADAAAIAIVPPQDLLSRDGNMSLTCRGQSFLEKLSVRAPCYRLSLRPI